MSEGWPNVTGMMQEQEQIQPPAEPTVAVGAGGEPGQGSPINWRSSLSPSRASDFMTCPLLYRFRVIDKLPERPSIDAVRGSVVHKVLENLFDLPSVDRTHDAAALMLGPAWQGLLADEPELAEMFGEGPPDLATWLDQCRDLLGRYFALEDPQRLEPAEREVHVVTTLDSGLTLHGYIDRLDLAPSGELRIVDYKTGKSPGERFEARALFQMRFYALVVWRTRGVIPALLQLIYLGNAEMLRYRPDEADLLATERKVQALWEAIQRATTSGEWRPNKSALCAWCDHQAICPAWGGTPPPLPEPVLPESQADEVPTAAPGPVAAIQ
ncbi:MAG: putative RecB family exonuclease [Nocardioidaceae bacterium]|jgi:putative RecB family exonuclease|nr:putative RecB family exonuclease [Nocardioidaceae bacterium]